MIQLAARLTGLTVIATASRPETTEWVRKLGASHVADHSRPLDEAIKAIGFNGVDYVGRSLQRQGVLRASLQRSSRRDTSVHRQFRREHPAVQGEECHYFLGNDVHSRGYFVTTVGRDEEMIRAYIRNQEIADQQLDQFELKISAARNPNNRPKIS